MAYGELLPSDLPRRGVKGFLRHELLGAVRAQVGFSPISDILDDYIADGEGRPVITIQGYLQTEKSFSAFEDKLRQHNWYVDNIPLGRPSKGFELVPLVERKALQLSDKYGCQVSLAGHSAGSAVAREVKIMRPEIIGRIAAIGGPFLCALAEDKSFLEKGFKKDNEWYGLNSKRHLDPRYSKDQLSIVPEGDYVVPPASTALNDHEEQAVSIPEARHFNILGVPCTVALTTNFFNDPESTRDRKFLRKIGADFAAERMRLVERTDLHSDYRPLLAAE